PRLQFSGLPQCGESRNVLAVAPAGEALAIATAAVLRAQEDVIDLPAGGEDFLHLEGRAPIARDGADKVVGLVPARRDDHDGQAEGVIGLGGTASRMLRLTGVRALVTVAIAFTPR